MEDIIFEYGITDSNPVGDLFPSYRVSDRPARTANLNIRDLCPNDEHDQRKDFEKCGICHATLCTLCGTDRHFTSEGHDLDRPEYWGV